MNLKASQIVDELYARGYHKKIVWSFHTFAITTFHNSIIGQSCVIVHGVKNGEFTDETMEVAGHPITCLNTGTMFKATNLKGEFKNADAN